MQTQSGDARPCNGRLRAGEMVAGPDGTGLPLNRNKAEKYPFKHVWSTGRGPGAGRTCPRNVLRYGNGEIFVCAGVRCIPAEALTNELSGQSRLVKRRFSCIPEGLNVRGALSSICRRRDSKRPAYTMTGSGGSHLYHWNGSRSRTNRDRAGTCRMPSGKPVPFSA